MEKIIEDRLYKPSEIVSNGFILDTKNNSNYDYVLNIIKTGILEAVNKGTGKTKYYMVSGAEIKRYKREVEGLEI